MRLLWAAAWQFVWSIAAQSIPTVLPQQIGLTTFTSYLSQFPDLLAELDVGNFTILAPTDEAFTSFRSSNPSINTTNTDELRALLQYHILQDLHPFLSFTSSPQFLPTILTNSNYTNVTGGQRVEAISYNGTVSLFSAVKAISNIVTADALFMGGVIHTIDRVLSIPAPVPATITRANLNDLVALLSTNGWLTSPAVLAAVTDLHDLTIFICNDRRYSGSFTGWKGLSNGALQSLFEYALVDGVVAYSSSLKNQSTFKTVWGENVTITVLDGATYVDASKVKSTDYLTSNGVIQVLDSPLNPNTTDARPTVAPAPSRPEPGLPGAVKAGIAVAVSIIVLACLIGLMFVMRAREQRRLKRLRQQQELEDEQQPPPQVYEKEVEKHAVWELDGRQGPRLSGSVRSQPADARRATRQFFKTVSIHL